MKTLKKTIAIVSTLILCLTFCASTFAASDEDGVVQTRDLSLTPSLTRSVAKLRGRSSGSEYITVSFDLYSASGAWVGGGSAAGYGQATASDSVTLASGTYRMEAQIASNSGSDYSKTYYLSV
ncbi:MAG: hypothetical protein RRZ24_00715 [Clostridia bacterium]